MNHGTFKNELTDKEMIALLKEECRRIKIQRNEFEQQLIKLSREVFLLRDEIKSFKKRPS